MTLIKNRKRVMRWFVGLCLAILLAAVIMWLLIWYGPDLIARHDVGNVIGPLRVLRLQQARDAARGHLLTLGAGLFAAGALLFTAQNYRIARQTLDVARQGQVTDRFTRAIEQLGSDKLDVRVGGIFALGRVAFDSTKDERVVMEVLCTFIREHSHEPWPLPGPDNPNPERMTRPDIQAAITMIGQPSFDYDSRGIGLRRANLTDADLGNLYLNDVSLYKAALTRTDLTGATFHIADLTRVNLSGANLTGAELSAADLSGANFTDANLSNVDLTGVTIPGR